MFSIRARTPALRFPARTILARFESTEVATDSDSSPLPLRPKARRTHNLTTDRSFTRTHFLTIPIYEHSPELQSTIRTFRDRILKCDLPGFTEDTVVPRLSEFLELRLGHLNIEGFTGVTWQQRRPYQGQPLELTRAEKGPIPMSEVLEVLEGLKAPIQKMLSGVGKDGALHIPLGHIRPMLHGPRGTFNARKVNVLFLQPNEGPSGDSVRAINELVFQRFKEASMWIDVHRPATLSMTLVNSRYGPNNSVNAPGQKPHIDLLELYESEAFRAYSAGTPWVPDGKIEDDASPRPVNLGEGIARSIHLIPSQRQEGLVPEPSFKLEF